jgi:hypothetical protein
VFTGLSNVDKRCGHVANVEAATAAAAGATDLTAGLQDPFIPFLRFATKHKGNVIWERLYVW